MDLFIALLLGTAIGIVIGRRESPPQPEQPKDYTYYKNLSESLLNDVKRMREELRKRDGTG
jgi:hypothetical protein